MQAARQIGAELASPSSYLQGSRLDWPASPLLPTTLSAGKPTALLQELSSALVPASATAGQASDADAVSMNSSARAVAGCVVPGVIGQLAEQLDSQARDTTHCLHLNRLPPRVQWRRATVPCTRLIVFNH